MDCLKNRIEDCKKSFDAASLKSFIEGIYNSDHWPSFKSFHKTARYVADTLDALDGVEARVIEFPADGQTMYGDWIMPCAWDAHSAVLKDLSSGEVIVDYEKVPTAMVMGSGATPADGIQAELIYVEKADELAAADIKDKIILCGFNPQGSKKLINENGGLAVLFATVIGEGMDDAVRWINSWADDPSQWSTIKGDTPTPALSLSVSQAEQLKSRLASGETINLDLNIQTETYDGTLPVVEAFVVGETADEVFMTGHLYEQGANDNASGGATMMEIIRIFAGTKPKRGIRALFTSEIYGTVPYCHENKDVLKNCIAGINIDSTAEVGRKSQKMDIIQNPLTNPSFVNILMKSIVDASGHADQFAYQGFLLDDNLVTDPAIDIPCVLVGVCSKNWHTSFDTLDIIDWDLFNLTTQLCATWVDVVANGGEDEATVLKNETEAFIENWESGVKEQEREVVVSVFQDDYLNDTKNAFRSAVNKIHPVYDALADQVTDESAVERIYFACPSLSQMSAETRQSLGLNMWSGNAYYPLFYANGARSKERIAAYMNFSFKAPFEKTMRTLDGYEEAAYLR